VLLGVVAALGMAEFALRLLPLTTSHDVRELHELRPDRPWLYGMRPARRSVGPGGVRYGSTRTGCDHSYARPSPPGTFRVVVLGHSIAFGWGFAVEDTYPRSARGALSASARLEAGRGAELA